MLLLAAITLSFRRQQYRQLTHGIPGTALGDWKWDAAARVSGVIDELAAKGEPVLASWPGYILGSQATAYPGTENHFGLGCSALLGSADRREYRILSGPEIRTVVNNHRVRLAAVGDASTPAGMTPSLPYRDWLSNAGYKRHTDVGGISIWVLPQLKAPGGVGHQE